MSSVTAPYLFTEARLNIEPTSPGSILHIPTANQSFFSPRKRARLDDDQELDEEAYTKKHIASESSIFFRRKDRSPRSFLWRILDERKSLEIQCVDLVQGQKNTQESLLTFVLSFTNPVRQNGIAFADSTDHDALDVFVLTTTSELFTFQFRKDLLIKAEPPSTDFDPSTCFKSFTPSSFTFRHPYKLVALSSLELLLSLHDGGLLRLERKSGDNGSQWRESFFSEGGWGSSLRGLIPWKGHNTVRFGNLDLEAGTTAAMEASPDSEHVLAVSLDHTLKAWNARTGKTGVQTDILGEIRTESSSRTPYLIDPSQTALLKVLEVSNPPDGDLYYVVTNSPKDHQFKFWAIRDADSVAHGIRDVQSDVRLIPPIDDFMNTNAWSLADFHIRPGPGWRHTQLWIRARSGAVCKVFTLTFDLLSSTDDLEDAWKNRWAAVDDGSMSVDRLFDTMQLPTESAVEPSSLQTPSVADQWIDYIFFPNRFSTSTVEAALHIYRKGLNMLTVSRSAEAAKPLKERLRNAVAAQVKVRRTSDGHPDVEAYTSDVAAQWTMFFGLLRHLHQRRTDSLSLAMDTDTELCWSIRSDQVSPIRSCSESEVHILNVDIFSDQDEEWILNSLPLADALPDETSIHVARLTAGAHLFRASLSASSREMLKELTSVYALHDGGTKITAGRRGQDVPALHELYDRCGFADGVSDEDFNNLTHAMEDIGGLGDLDNNLFIATLERLTETSRGRNEEQALTSYGDKITIRVAQDALLSGRDTLLDLLALVVFMSQDLEPEELSADFAATELYKLLITRLRDYNILLWLASNVRQESPRKRKGSQGETLHSRTAPSQPTLTVFESIFIGDWQSLRFPQESLPNLITYWSRAWTFGPSLGAAYDGVTAHIMGNLLKHGNHSLAVDFSRFLSDSPWSTYLKARLYMGEGENAYASEFFKRACTGLSEKSRTRVESLDTAGLLSATQSDGFADGPARYYLHISDLFEESKLLSYTADFAALALHELESESDEGLDSSIADLDRRKQSMHGSPAAARVDLAMEEIRLLRVSGLKDDVLSRLFNASLQTSRFETAFDALSKFSNPVFRRASLQQLLQSLLNSSSTTTLLTLPFPTDLLLDVDSVLASLTRKHLSTSATETPTTPPYERILYAWRIQQQNYRGAASVLHERLERLKSSKDRAFEPDDDTLTDAYLMLINTLACCGESEGWILADGEGQKDQGAVRRIVTLEDVRREYQAELDSRSEILQGRFPLVGMEIDVL